MIKRVDDAVIVAICHGSLLPKAKLICCFTTSIVAVYFDLWNLFLVIKFYFEESKRFVVI
jgi:predicted membrane chloride channel (bestrophin family)